MTKFKPIFEEFDYDYFMEQMLNQISDDMDKREGTVIWDALAPASIEFANQYFQMDEIYKNMFSDTADREFLIKHGKDRKTFVYPATYALIKGKFDKAIEIGTRFNLRDLNYKVEKFLSFEEVEENGKPKKYFYYSLRCETSGEIGNIPYGQLLPMTNIQGLKYAETMELLIPGEDEEDTEHFRNRVLDSFHDTRFGGNIADYKDFVGAIQGVGKVRVIPVWDGPTTVKVVFLNSENKPPTTELVDEVQTKVDPTQNAGEGKGIAPIWHFVTVEGAGADEIQIKTKIEFEKDYTFDTLQVYIEEAIDRYLQSLRSGWDNEENTVVRVSRIESAILDIDGVLDVLVTQINGKSSNYIVKENAVPILGDVVHDESLVSCYE